MSIDSYLLGVEITQQYYRENPQALEKYGEKGRKACQSDIINHITYLQQAANIDSYMAYREYVSWNKTLFKNLNIEDHGLLAVLKSIQQNLVDYPKMFEILGRIIDEYDEIPVHMPPSSNKNDNQLVAEQYLNLLLERNRAQAYNLITDLYNQGTHLSTIYVEILQQVQYMVGYLWHTNKVTVAQEHYITQATRLLMGKLYHQNPPIGKVRGKVLAACVPGELHDIGLQMVADILELDSWRVDYFGPNTPQASILDYIMRERPDIVALSVTIPTHIDAAKSLIHAIRLEYPDVKVITGGYSFRQNEELWRKLNSDGYARDAIDAIKLVDKLITQ